jgi:hypothetical protein
MLAGLAAGLLGKVVGKGLDIIDKLVPDKDLATKLKAEFQKEIMVTDHSEFMALIEGQVKIILAEATGGWLQRNWRPILMLTIVAIVANNYLLHPYLSFFTTKTAVLDLPQSLWNLMSIGVGGYIVGRSAEKVVTKWKGDKA